MEPAAMPIGPFKPFLQFKRDVGMILGGFTGRTPAPFHTRSGKHRVGISPRPFVVREVIRETPDAVTLCLEDPTGAPVSFVPGQFFTLVLSLGGEEFRRAYSASSAPGGGVRLTVKRVADGRVSSYLNDHLEAGSLLRLLGPSGEFVTRGTPELVLVAGGSGITPMRSILEACLLSPAGPRQRVCLIYGNRSERDVIFQRELQAWAERFPRHFRYVEVLSEPEGEYAGPRSLLTRDCLASLLAEHAPAEADFMLCGPEGMLVEARAALAAHGVPKERIREERFTQPHLRQRAADLPQVAQPVKLRLGKDSAAAEFEVAPGRTLLEAALAAGAEVPIPARWGCGRCKVKLLSGDVVMDEPNCLSEEERQQGFVLGCVGRPLGPCEVEVEV
ncbi:MAG: ferredoxin--NADP reductase [Polyangiaceae bacterium]